MLLISNLTVSVDEKTIVHSIDLSINTHQVHALMGPNGSGKSTLALTLMGHPHYQVDHGVILFDAQDITHLSPDKRARAGLFLSFQQPPPLAGVQVFTFFKEACRALRGNAVDSADLYEELCDYMDLLGIDQHFIQRNIHEGFSGGEKKRFELLQLLMFKPKLAILDELDSGLDVDGLKLLGRGLQLAQEQTPDLSLLIITHYQRVLDYIRPTDVHVMSEGKLIAHGDYTLVATIEKQGYHAFRG
jgi:Fe-S cluster assembly ATP-binding protein